MLDSFEISSNMNEDYTYSYKLEDSIHISYNLGELFNVSEKNGKKLISYGYLFDVRNPKTDVKDTLNELVETSDNFLDSIKYLNGHFILLFNFNGEWKLITDAVSMTPVYFDQENKLVNTFESDELASLNGLMILDLQDFSISRIELSTNKLSDERIERVILDLLINQYEYFLDKDITLNFRRNKMNKAIISTLHPALLHQTLNLRENDDITVKIGKWLSRDYKMSLLDEESEPATTYLANTHLMDYNAFMNKETGLSAEQLANFNEFYLLNTDFLEVRGSIEYHLLNNLRYRNEKKSHLIYDPFNVIAIQEIIYGYSNDKTFDPLTRIVKIIHPSIDFYDFVTGENLLQKYNKLKKQNKRLIKEMKNYKNNQEFLDSANAKGIKVTDNLDGTVQSDGINFFPASQSISKDDIFEVQYKRTGQGMILVESFFDNPKNSHRIKVNLDGEIFNVGEFLNGKFINVDSEINIKMSYERDYDAASWQKAGRIMIKEID